MHVLYQKLKYYFYVGVISLGFMYPLAVWAQDENGLPPIALMHFNPTQSSAMDQGAILFMGTSHGELDDTDGQALFDELGAKYFSHYVIEHLKNDGYSPEKTILLFEGVKGPNAKYSMVSGRTQNFPNALFGFPREAQDEIAWVINVDYRTILTETHRYLGEDYFCAKFSAYTGEKHITSMNNLAEYVNDASGRLDPECVQSENFKQKARALFSEHLNFELYYLQLAHYYADQGYKVIIGAGAAHILRYLTVFDQDQSDYIVLLPVGERAASFVDQTRRSTYLQQWSFPEKTFKELRDWKGFRWHLKDLPNDLQEALYIDATNTVITDKQYQYTTKSVLKPEVWQAHASNLELFPKVVTYYADLFAIDSEYELKTGTVVYFDLKNGDTVQLKFIDPKDTITGPELLMQTNVSLRGLDSLKVPHPFYFPVYYFAVANEQSSISMNDLVGVRFEP